MTLKVICVLRSGGIYDATWVARLKAGVERHLSVPHHFICFSDVPVPCARTPLKHNWPGWWSKMEIFQIDGPALYIDLDTAVTGSLDDIAEQAENWQFTVLRDFYREKGIGSGVMAWNVDLRRLYDEFRADADAHIARIRTRGDQHFIEERVRAGGIARWQDVLPGQIVSYKAHVRARENIHEIGDGSLPPDARLVCLHGQPKFIDMPAGDPVRAAWEAAAA